jgi:cell wall-associated NlpC family hydrolase
MSGVVGTVAVTGAATPASADEKPTERTGELPVIDTALAHHAARAAQATEAYAAETGAQDTWQRAQDRAAAEAQRAAAAHRAHVEAAAEAERQAREAAEAEEAAAREAAAEEAAAREAAAREAASGTQTLTAPSTPAPDTGGSGGAIVSFVRAQLGDGYALGSNGPGAWDCSSLVQAAYATVGVSLPRVAADQSVAGVQVSLDALQPGDILYWGGAGTAYHVAVYTGGGMFIGAQNSSTGVVERDLGWDTPSGAVRVL